MKVCPNCGREYQDYEYMCICGCQLEKKPASAGAGLEVSGNNNAISSHVDSHDVYHNNVSNTTNNNNYIQQAQKTAEEIHNENLQQFLAYLHQCNEDGVIDNFERQQLLQYGQGLGLTMPEMEQLIQQVRNSTPAQQTAGTDYLSQQTLKQVVEALDTCNLEVIGAKYANLEHMAMTNPDEAVQYYYHMLQASRDTGACLKSFQNAQADNYWQMYWTCVAALKGGNKALSAQLINRIGRFAYPIGNMDLLMAIESLANYHAHPQQKSYLAEMKNALENAMANGMTEYLNPVWCALNEAMSDDPQPGEFIKFYTGITLREIFPQPAKKVPAMPGMPQMPGAGKQTPGMPGNGMPDLSKPNMAAQQVKLGQMQGFNPLQAAQQMGMAMSQPVTPVGGMGQMPQMQMQQMQMPQMQMPQMGGNMMGMFSNMAGAMNQIASQQTAQQMPSSQQMPQQPVTQPSLSQQQTGIPLWDKLRTDFTVMLGDAILYDTDEAEEDDIECFISNIRVQNVDEENETLDEIRYTDADSFTEYLDEDEDGMHLAQKIVAAAYCASEGIWIDDDTCLQLDTEWYKFSDSTDLYYEYEIDIDLG